MATKTGTVIVLAIALSLSSSIDPGVPLQGANTNAAEDCAQLIARIAHLEARVEQLEIQLSLMLVMTAKPDENGILRDIMGRAIGYWGIDGVY